MIEVDSFWKQVPDLTMNDAAHWMAHKCCPRWFALRCEYDENFARYHYARDGEELTYKRREILMGAVRTGVISVTAPEAPLAEAARSGKTTILKTDWLAFCAASGETELVQAFSDEAAGAAHGGTAGARRAAAISECNAAPMRHSLKGGRQSTLTAEIDAAKKMALDPNNPASVWDALVQLAEKKIGAMVGFTSDGTVQYRGKKFQDCGEFDVFTLRNLRNRMAREKARVAAA